MWPSKRSAIAAILSECNKLWAPGSLLGSERAPRTARNKTGIYVGVVLSASVGGEEALRRPAQLRTVFDEGWRHGASLRIARTRFFGMSPRGEIASPYAPN